MSTLRQSLLCFFLALLASPVAAQITLKDAKEAAIPIAIQNFVLKTTGDAALKVKTDLEATLTANLIFSRLFKVIPSEAFLESEIKGPINILQVDSWRQVGAMYVARAELTVKGSEATLVGYVFNVMTGKLEHQRSYTTKRKDKNILAHRFGDDIVKVATGQQGLFSTKIAFVYTPPKKTSKEIWVMDFNGRNPQPLVQNGRTNLSPEWTANGKKIIFTSSSVIDWHLWDVDLKGKSRKLTNFKGSALGPSVMPNGRDMIVSLSKDGNAELYLMSTSGKIKKRLTKRRAIDISPSISPNGKEICFSSGRLGQLHIFHMDLVTNKISRLTRVGTNNDTCAWNPRQNLVLFSGMDLDREFDIFGMDKAGNEMERLTFDAKNNESPSWSPDGKLIVFSSKRTGKNQIYIMKADGTQLTPLVKLPGDASQPAWSPRLGY